MAADFTRKNSAQLEQAKTHIVYCEECCQYDHDLPHESYLLSSGRYWVHRHCGGGIRVSRTTTHDMLDASLTPDQERALQQEISERVAEIAEQNRILDIRQLKRVHQEIERRNRGERNTLLPDSVYKRSSLSNPEGVPYCPNCDSLLVQPIRAKKRFFSVGFFGLASDTIGKTMECLSCKYKW